MMMQLASAMVYFISIILLRQYFDLRYIDIEFMMKVVFITFVSWLPFQLIYYLVNMFDPSDNVKVMSARNPQ